MAATTALLSGFAAGVLGDPGSNHHGKSGHGGNHHRVPAIKDSLAPSQPTDPTYDGVSPDGLPWALTFGVVRLKSDGYLDLRVKGLIIPSMGTPGPLTSISAALYLRNDTTAAGTTPDVPLSSKGNARIHDTSFAVPSTCLAPVIVVQPHGTTVPPGDFYIAVNTWR